MTAVLTIDLADIDRYADALSAAAKAIVSRDVGEAHEVIGPIAFERWEGRLRYATKAGTSSDTVERRARDVTDRMRAQVFLRDEMTCTYCGGRCIPRNVLVAFSDLFPDELPYHPNYRAVRSTRCTGRSPRKRTTHSLMLAAVPATSRT